MSPVWMMKAGSPGIASTLSIAASKVFRASGLAGFEKPMWLSDSCTKEKPPSAALAEPIRRDDGTPPATVQTTPVPAQSMHFRDCRRSRPPSSCREVMSCSLPRGAQCADRRETRGKGGLFLMARQIYRGIRLTAYPNRSGKKRRGSIDLALFRGEWRAPDERHGEAAVFPKRRNFSLTEDMGRMMITMFPFR